MKGKINNSILGCRICKNPLEIIDPIIYANKQRNTWAGPPARNKIRATKHNERAAVSDRLVPFDPTPVATRCGHIFHRGCLKKLVAENASSRIDCPACRKPTVLSQTHPVKIFYPQNVESCRQRILRQNKENENLSSQLADCRRTRMERKIAYDAAISHVDKIRSEVTSLDDKIQLQLEQLKTMEINGITISSLQEDLPKVQKNIMEMTHRNSGLLTRMERVLNQMGDSQKRDDNLRCLSEARERFCGLKSKEFPGRYSTLLHDSATAPIGGKGGILIPSSDRPPFERSMMDKESEICESFSRAEVNIKRRRGVLNLLPIENHKMTYKFTPFCENGIKGEAEGLQNRRRNKSVHTKRESRRLVGRRKYCKRLLLSPPTEESPQGMAELVLDIVRHGENHAKRV